MESFGRIMIALGLVVTFLGVIFLLGSKIGIGRLPGDIVIKRGNFTFFFPLATSILLSILLTVIMGLINLFGRR